METPPSSTDWVASLDEAERKILDLILCGYEDEAIAEAAGMSVPAVIYARVRLRAKLGSCGPPGGAEIVLRDELSRRNEALIEESRRLRDEAVRNRKEALRNRESHATIMAQSLHLMAFAYAADALLLAETPGRVTFANLQAERLFGADAGGLLGLPTRSLAHPGLPADLRDPVQRLLGSEGLEEEISGVKRAFYGCRRDGSPFRAIVRARRFRSTNAPYAVISVRPVLDEAEAIAEALRQPLETS